MARLAQSMSIGSLGQAISSDLGRAYSAGLIELHNPLERPATASDRRPQRGDIGALRLWRLCARSDEGRAAARLQHREGPLRHVAADRVKHGVAIGNRLREI